MEKEIHPIQANILLVLLFKPESRFTDLNTTGISTDHFNFHVKRLVELGLIQKIKGHYKLTARGKEFANRFDTSAAILERQAKVSVLVCCTKIKDKTTYFLMQERLKEPYFGFLGMISGKIRWGETALEAAKREFKEETNLSGDPKFIGIEHKIDYAKNGKLLEDKFFFVFLIQKFQGKLKKKIEGGRNEWMSQEEIINSKKTFGDVYDIFSLVTSKKFGFIEKRYKEKKY